MCGVLPCTSCHIPCHIRFAAAYVIIANSDAIGEKELKDYINKGRISESLQNIFTAVSGQFQGDEREERIRFRPDESKTVKPKSRKKDDYER